MTSSCDIPMQLEAFGIAKRSLQLYQGENNAGMVSNSDNKACLIAFSKYPVFLPFWEIPDFRTNIQYIYILEHFTLQGSLAPSAMMYYIRYILI